MVVARGDNSMDRNTTGEESKEGLEWGWRSTRRTRVNKKPNRRHLFLSGDVRVGDRDNDDGSGMSRSSSRLALSSCHRPGARKIMIIICVMLFLGRMVVCGNVPTEESMNKTFISILSLLFVGKEQPNIEIMDLLAMVFSVSILFETHSKTNHQ